ncbi:MAG: PAS domain S-box protein [Anaerolineales bacterium]|nr:PAS domain S-box protein [Anaerolineales bacterium]
MSQSKPTYEELKQRCQTAEAVLAAIRSGQADMIIGDQGVLVLRLAEAEKALRLNRERLSLTLEAARAGTWEWNLQTNENYWSEELWPVYGLEPHCCQPSYEAWLQTIHPADRAGAAQAVQTAAANGTELNAEWRVLDRDGTERWLMSRGRPVRDAAGDVVRYIGIVFDITERKRTEVALRESEVRFRQIYEHMDVGVAQVSLDYRIEAANEAYCRMLGYDEEELVGQYLTDITHSETVAENLRRQAQLVTGEIDHYRMEKQFVHKNGRVVHGILDANLVRDAQGKPRYCLGSVLDITERRQAEDALRESEARYRLLAENMADVIWILNANSLRFTYVSPSVERLRGYSVAEVMTQPMAQVVTPDSLTRINAGFPERLQAFLAGDPAAVTRTSEIEQTCQDGSTIWTEVVTTLLRNEAGEIEVLGVSRDISAANRPKRPANSKVNYCG